MSRKPDGLASNRPGLRHTCEVAAVKAIVFDANVFGKDPIPNVDMIEVWAGACADHQAELWIPEIVAYELAEHAASAERSFLETYERHRKRRSRMGLDRLPPMAPILQEDVVDAIRDAGAVVVEVPLEAAREAILDQVRQRGAATRKSDVKTGAADSAWVRSVVSAAREAEEDTWDGLVIVTADTDALVRTCEVLDMTTPRHVRNIQELRELLDEEGPASEDQVNLLTATIRDHLEGAGFGGPDLAEIAGLDRTRGNWWDVRLDDDGYEPWEFQEAYLTPERDFEIVGQPEWDGWSQSLVAEVLLTTDVEEQYARQDRWGDEPEYRALGYKGSVRGRITFAVSGEELETDWVMELPELERVADEDLFEFSLQ